MENNNNKNNNNFNKSNNNNSNNNDNMRSTEDTLTTNVEEYTHEGEDNDTTNDVRRSVSFVLFNERNSNNNNDNDNNNYNNNNNPYNNESETRNVQVVKRNWPSSNLLNFVRSMCNLLVRMAPASFRTLQLILDLLECSTR